MLREGQFVPEMEGIQGCSLTHLLDHIPNLSATSVLGSIHKKMHYLGAFISLDDLENKQDSLLASMRVPLNQGLTPMVGHGGELREGEFRC